MPIRILSDAVAAQIAAGEVIERPASVVKELIENSLDAGATRIDVDIAEGGVRLIRIRDDGHGINTEEVELALTRHATSKLQTVHDLDNIHTLGFRGEALASIASVSRLTMTTRTADAEQATQAFVEGSEIKSVQSIGAQSGTTIQIENLFFNVPARRKFLKTESTERRHISNLLMRYAMAYPDVRFSFQVEGREAFRTSGNGVLSDVVIDTLGLDVFRDMVEVIPLPNRRPDLPPIRVHGFTTTPNQTRSNRSQIILFVNGRSIQDQRLTYAVVQAYHTLMPHGRYPIAVLLINLPPDVVDVNVHPTKAEVRFSAPDAVFSAVQRSVREAVAGGAEIRPVQTQARTWDAPINPMQDMNYDNMPRVVNPTQLGIDMGIEDNGRRVSQIEERETFPIDVPPALSERPRKLPPLRIVGQIAATYIVAEGPAGMYLVDQHAAHERIMYEIFMARHEAQGMIRQHTLESAVVELAPINARFVEENVELLKDIGFDIEPFGSNAFRVRSVPAMLADYDPMDVLQRIVQDIEQGDTPGARDIEDKIVRRVCKTASVKAGQILSYDEMLGILKQLERCENPLTCPHGRPTMIHMSASELANQFGRT